MKLPLDVNECKRFGCLTGSRPAYGVIDDQNDHRANDRYEETVDIQARDAGQPTGVMVTV
jgi:hypothetical protein